MRREFELREEDESFLERRGFAWETIRDGGVLWVLIHGFPLPDGYNHPEASVAVMMTPGYPDAQLDMAYFHPALNRADGKPVERLTPQNLDGKVWQQWSRHRTPQNPWRSGFDNLETHTLMVEEWLKREFQKR